MARENKLTIRRLSKPRSVHEASGAKLDIIGTADMFVKIRAIGKTKQLRCLILRGSNVDREVLISCRMLKRWGLIHETFPHETVGSYVRRTIKSHKIAAIYEKSATPSKVLVSKVPTECKKLKNKILKKYADVFKDKLEKTDRVNIPPVKLQIDESRKISPVYINTPFDVSYHLRKPAKEEFREMVNAGIIVPNNEPSDWCSQAFPRLKPGVGFVFYQNVDDEKPEKEATIPTAQP